MADQEPSPCCSPARRSAPADSALTSGACPLQNAAPTNPALDSLRRLAGGAFLMGNEDGCGYPADGEGPVRVVQLQPFWIEPTAVSNAQFAAFVAATGYRTQAERFGWSFVFAGLLPDDFVPTRGVAEAPWWRQVHGADWRHPEGPHSTLDQRDRHPVVHVSWNDAAAYCAWRGLRLPTEAQWEYAARGGLAQRRYPWGDELTPAGVHRMNVWQGRFPAENTLADGYDGTAPVDAFPPNDYGLYNMTGNVWEWCENWFDPLVHLSGRSHDPFGPSCGLVKALRGGSYLCHESYCFRYRVAARSSNTPESSAGNIGFRCIREEST